MSPFFEHPVHVVARVYFKLCSLFIVSKSEDGWEVRWKRSRIVMQCSLASRNDTLNRHRRYTSHSLQTHLKHIV